MQQEGVEIMSDFDMEHRWPELFKQLDEEQRRAVLQSLAAAWHEGWVPNRDDVKDLVDDALGLIDEDEYFQRARDAARRATPTTPA